MEPWGLAWLFNVVHMYHENSSIAPYLPSLKLTFSHLKMDGWNTMEYDRYDRFREGKCHSSSICSPRDSPRQNELHRRGGDGGGEVSSTSLFRGRFLKQTASHTATWMYPNKGSSIEIFGIFF